VVELFAEAYRLRLMRGLEDSLARTGAYEHIAGVDEVGRGALAGPVVAAAVIPDPGRLIPGVDDSKRLSAAARERLADAIRSTSIASAVVAVPPADIDRINILQATKKAMCGALRALSPAPDLAIIDAVRLAESPCPVLPVIRGDLVSYAVACASILAKVARDRTLVELHEAHPQYRFDSNKGYGAAVHLEALAAYGPSPHHRLTFRSVLPRHERAS
jgi:ribonuclease HII